MRRKVLSIATYFHGKKQEKVSTMEHRKRIKSRLFILRSWLKTGRRWGDWYRQEKGIPLTEEEKCWILHEIQRLEEERAQLKTARTCESV